MWSEMSFSVLCTLFSFFSSLLPLLLSPSPPPPPPPSPSLWSSLFDSASALSCTRRSLLFGLCSTHTLKGKCTEKTHRSKKRHKSVESALLHCHFTLSVSESFTLTVVRHSSAVLLAISSSLSCALSLSSFVLLLCGPFFPFLLHLASAT